MSNQIQTIATATAANWSTSLSIDGASGDIVFHTVGGTFSDGNTQKTVSPVNGQYTVAVTGSPPTDQGTTQIVSVYYEFDNEWQISQQASRILVLPQSREIDYRIQRKGFGELPKESYISSSYNGLVLVGETKVPTGEEFKKAIDAGHILSLNLMPSSLFDTTKSPFIAHDRYNGKVFFLNAAPTLDKVTVGAVLADTDDQTIVQVFERLNGQAREFTVFYASGLVEVYDKGMNFLSQADTGITNTARVVYRRKNVGSNGSADTYVVLDNLGQAHTLNASYSQTSVLNDQFYTDASDTYNVLCTRSGRLVGSGTSNQPAGFAFYQFVPGTLIAVGVNAATGAVCQFNIRDNALYAPSRNLVQDNRVVYNAAADWTADGTGLVGGLDTDGTDSLIRFADGTTATFTDPGFSYLGIYGTSYTDDSSSRRFYAVARPTRNLMHLNQRDYSATIPDFDQIGSANVQFSLTVKTADKDIPLEIRFPDGVVWTAKVNGQPVKYVQDGDVVQFTASHPTITRHSFAFTIGRSSGLFELKPDTLPDAFHFESVSGIDEGEVYSTEEITITGINTKVPVSVTVNGQPATDNVQIFIDGVEATEPFMIANNGKLRLEVLHEGTRSRVVVTVGTGSTNFGIYTVAEPILNSIRNWAYQATGIEVVSDALTNPGPQQLNLTLTDDTTALFSNGTKQVTLDQGQSATIKFTPQENKQYHVTFNTDQTEYDWQVWADNVWLDPQPATQRAERYVLGDSGDIKFDAIPPNFYTHLRVPAGILLQIDGSYVNLPLDVRGVYNAQTEIRNVACTSVLRMEGLPSHDQPHTILLGDAKLKWLYDFTVDPTYQAIADKAVATAVPQFVARTPNTIATNMPQFVATSVSARTDHDQDFDAQTGDKADTVYARQFVVSDAYADSEFLSRFVPHRDAVVTDSFGTQPVAGDDQLGTLYDNNRFVSAEAEAPVWQGFNVFDTAVDYDSLLLDLPTVRLVAWSKVSGVDSTSRARYATSPITAQIDNAARAEWIQSSPALGQSNDRAQKASGTHNWIDALVPQVILPTARIDVDAAQALQRQYTSLPVDGALSDISASPVTYHVDSWEPRWTHVPRITFRYDMYVGIVTKPKSYPISMHGRTVGKTLTYKLNIRVRHVYDLLHRLATGKIKYAPATKVGKVVNAKSAFVVTKAAYGQKTSVGRVLPVVLSASINVDAKFVAVPASNPVDTAQADRKTNTVIAVTQARPTRPVVKVINVPRPVTEMPPIAVDYGEQDPLKQGYFATELDALRNATEVWGHDPTAVYGIKQPNGYWTWAQVVVCENVCGSYGCDTRGYLSGG
ncbi:hypothetical protein pEaSNUABM5_00157 [Erwinia phage pEa_SNUABM_5]|uniref:Uncharacterized protein n=1 Tax=Erwinia phage pEa_SNUABM_5 TaxID=2797313 RepID=A0A7T8EQ21_9CAUD|nr:hypothetical protein MPK73_gp157 [Erwinia phage pEa_SNUABM_5]QQO90299.1 hypothetical protein pEaSNUABM5_00157 [Erwinia phage pEa_SNUABM_5]